MRNYRPLVTGEILIEYRREVLALLDSFNVRIFVRLMDVSLIDTASTVILQQDLKGPYHQRCDTREGGKWIAIPFKLIGKIPNKKAEYAISVHVDRDGDGVASEGDYINMESIPVLTHGHPSYASVKVKRISPAKVDN